ncbi:MAG: metal-dependent transcriptional regulator [Candidatus Methanospirareceae archaeon]
MLSRKIEDYLEAILNITEEKGYAKIKDIASTLGVKPPSVVEMVKKLDKMGFVEYRRYEGVILTEKGRIVGKAVQERHRAIRTFLEIIKVPKEIANKDACIMEHELEPETIGQIRNLVEFIMSNPEWLRHFEMFCVTARHQREVTEPKEG